LIAASVKFSFRLNIGCPKNYNPKKFILDWVKKNRRVINIFHDPKKAVQNADVIFSDKVVSLNDQVNAKQKIKKFKKFKIDERLLRSAKKNVIFLHCLPRGNEVTDGVFFGTKSHVWQQAANRVHVQKSILLYCFDKLR
jgi:ornithine carbamoyltransferase